MPAFSGLSAPYWDDNATAVIYGMSRTTGKAELVKAAIESIAYQVNDVFAAMENDLHCKPKEIRVDGGAISNNFLMQFQADISRCPVIRPKVLETTALGAAYLAGLAVGFWKDIDTLKKQWIQEKAFEPELEESRAEQLLAGWHKAVKRSLNWSDN